jgi:hypothetical protein
MKIAGNNNRNSSVVLTTLNGHIDQHGNLQSIARLDSWSQVSDKGGVDHYMKTNRYNSLRAKHKFVNNTQADVMFKWSINIITSNGQNIKYDFGTINIKAQATSFTVSIPYKCSHLLAAARIERIMVAIMVI